MADQVLFEVDASQILAKLHLAGLQPCTYDKNKEFIVNTGILDDDPKASPDKPGKVKFDLTNSTGEYQVGFVSEIEYHRAYGLTDAFNNLESLRAKVYGKDSKLADSPDSPEAKEFEKSKQTLAALLGKKADDKAFDSEEGFKQLRDEIEKAQQQDKTTYEEKLAAIKDNAVKQLNAYMKVFAGADNVETITNDSLGLVDVSDKVKGPNDTSFVKMYEIQDIPKAEKEKMEAASRAAYMKDPEKLNCKYKICCFVKYTLNVDK